MEFASNGLVDCEGLLKEMWENDVLCERKYLCEGIELGPEVHAGLLELVEDGGVVVDGDSTCVVYFLLLVLEVLFDEPTHVRFRLH